MVVHSDDRSQGRQGFEVPAEATHRRMQGVVGWATAPPFGKLPSFLPPTLLLN